jgi:hypothetical protein
VAGFEPSPFEAKFGRHVASFPLSVLQVLVLAGVRLPE